MVGIAHKPQQRYIDTDPWASNREIYLGKFEPESIPSFPFYQLMRKTKDLPQAFWPYLERTQMHTLKLSENEICATGASALATVLSGTQVYTLHLVDNRVLA